MRGRPRYKGTCKKNNTSALHMGVLYKCATALHRKFPWIDIDELVNETWYTYARHCDPKHLHWPYVKEKMYNYISSSWMGRIEAVYDKFMDDQPHRFDTRKQVEALDTVIPFLKKIKSDRNRDIVIQHIGHDVSTYELAKKHNISHQRVSQILKKEGVR